MLSRIIVVMGKKNLNPGRSTTISPGKRPIGSLESQGQRTPIRTSGSWKGYYLDMTIQKRGNLWHAS